MIRTSLLLIIGLITLLNVNAQTYERAFNINLTDSGVVTSSYLDADGNLFTGSLAKQVYSTSSRTVPGNPDVGELVVRKLSSENTEIWNYTIEGSIGLTMHMQTMSNGNLIVSGAFVDSLVIPGDTTLLASDFSASAFILSLDTNGALQWIKGSAANSTGGSYYKVFDIFENEIFLPYIHYDGFIITMKIKVLDEDGDSVNNYDLADRMLVISEFKMDEAGNTYLAGTGSGYSKIGGADIGGDTAFGYAVYIVKLDPNFEQIWSHENNYITFDFFPKLAFTRDRVAFITDTMPLQNGIGNHHLLKIFDHDGNRLYTDSVGPSYFGRMHYFMDIVAVNKGFMFATLEGFAGLEIRHIDRDFNSSSLATAAFSASQKYVGFVSNDSTIHYIHNYTDRSLVVNDTDTIHNQKNNTGWNGYQQAVISFSYENTTLGVKDLTASNTLVYPNPAQSHITVRVGVSDIGNTLKIYSMTGQIMQEVQIVSTETELDLSTYSTGIYTLTTGAWSRRIVKE